MECFNRFEWSCGLLYSFLFLFLIDGMNGQSNAVSFVIVHRHWFEGSVSVLCYDLYDLYN